MPLYEYSCDACRTTFEALVSLSASKQSTQACPDCGKRARRILSTVNFSADARDNMRLPGRTRSGQPDVTSLKLPPAARLCWMDDHAAARLAAHKAGRGAEYDDTVAARKEVASKRGDDGGDKHLDQSGGASQPGDSHSPLSDPAVFANRRKAAQKEKVVESVTIKKPLTPK